MSNYKEIIIQEVYCGIKIIINRPDFKNSLSLNLVQEIRQAIDEASLNDDYKIIIITGTGNFFCTGMDFTQCVSDKHDMNFTHVYMNLLHTMASVPKVVVSQVNGEVMAGGMGLVAASDLAVALPDARFSLSEGIWGIIPAMVAPYLIRKTNFNTAYKMTLTTVPLSANEAYNTGIIDKVGENPEKCIKDLCTRIYRIDSKTIGKIKRFYQKLWIIDSEIEKMAEKESADTILSKEVQNNIYNFVNYKMFPWEK